MKKSLIYLGLFVVVGLFLSSCSLSKKNVAVVESIDNNIDNNIDTPALASVDVNDELGNSGQMKKFSNYEELKSFLEARAVVLPDYYRSDVKDVFTAPDSDLDYSNINLQVVGINEADIIKTDGTYIYAVSYNNLFIIKASEGEVQILTQLNFPSRPTGLYLNQGKLVIMGVDTEIANSSTYKKFRRQSPYTFVKVFDLSDPTSPKQIRDLDFEGSYIDSRIVNNHLYLILDNYNGYIVGESIVPRLVDGGRVLPNVCRDDNACFAPNVYYFDSPYDHYNFVSINALDLATAKEPVSTQVYILNSTQNIYVSAKNIYLTYTKYLDERAVRLGVMQSVLAPRLSANENSILNKIEKTDSVILNIQEKQQKIEQIYTDFLAGRDADELLVLKSELEGLLEKKFAEETESWEQTMIYKLSLSGASPVYQAKASVPGTLLNQFSLDEDVSGNLRLITTISKNSTSLATTNIYSTNVYILSPQLTLLSSLENIASEEKIYTSRFLGNHVYLITFNTADPLYALNLSDPKSPKLLGKLKIPGITTYLYPYDEYNLIVLSKDTFNDVYGNAVTGGIRLSLFDIHDLNNPLELDYYVAGSTNSDSLALYSHKDFLFDKNKNLLSIPVSLTSGGSFLRPYFNGALIFSIENKKIVLRGQIDHSDGGKYLGLDSWCGQSCYDSSVRRIIYIKDLLYTVSNKYIKVSNLNDFSLKQILKLIPDSDIDKEAETILDPSILSLEDNNAQASEINLNEDTTVLFGPTLPPVQQVNENIDTSNSTVTNTIDESADILDSTIGTVMDNPENVNTGDDMNATSSTMNESAETTSEDIILP
ncbi:beta-propeller domain-containing protein [Patescibacteria group bacterium]|nr:beta-propeller domain-containing protein [Patescibacteria group bacterium]